jgi:hypothetical protein
MLYFFFLFLSLLVTIFFIVVLARAFSQWNSPIGIGLYIEALRDENNGHFEEAITAYETVLVQCKKIRFQGVFRDKIIGKVKLLHTIIDYNKSARFVR